LASYETASANAFSGKGEAANNNIFTGNMTVTVIDVMPNGNLLVSGEKQLAIGREQNSSVSPASSIQASWMLSIRSSHRVLPMPASNTSPPGRLPTAW
jgi:hypothetical protein